MKTWHSLAFTAVLVATAGAYHLGIKKTYAEFECNSGRSLAACDWLEEQ